MERVEEVVVRREAARQVDVVGTGIGHDLPQVLVVDGVVRRPSLVGGHRVGRFIHDSRPRRARPSRDSASSWYCRTLARSLRSRLDSPMTTMRGWRRGTTTFVSQTSSSRVSAPLIAALNGKRPSRRSWPK